MPLIKRYPNRKLYNTETKEYITLEGVADLICQGQEITVVDHLTGNDLTTVILTQIMFEQAKKQIYLQAIPLLTHLIQISRQHWEGLDWDIITSISDESIVRLIERLLANHHLSTRGDIVRLTHELEALNAKIEQLAQTRVESDEQ